MNPDKTPIGPRHHDRHLRRFFAGPEQFQGDEVVLSPSETHHLVRVLRLQKGERVEVSDGCGRIFAAEIALLEPAAARLRIITELTAARESSLQITLGLALVRSETFDLIVRQVTEMGIFRLVPFYSTRSLVKPESWKVARYSRWLRLAQGALKSSQRKILPDITSPKEYFGVLEGTEDLKILFWEDQRGHNFEVDLAAWPRPQSVRALIGPEGGFTASEVLAAQEAGFHLMGLGPRRLRVETAALAAVSILQYLWGDLGV
jgi:16S rRNA (uracil1498-N3)-methyltransferase